MSFWTWLFSFRGRIARRLLWGAMIWYLIADLAIVTVAYLTFRMGPLPLFVSDVLWFALNVLYVATVYSAIAVTVKRFHDRGKTGWLILMPFVFLPLMLSAFNGRMTQDTLHLWEKFYLPEYQEYYFGF